MSVTLESRPKRQDHVLSQKSEDTLVMLSLENGQYFALDEIGVRVWELADGCLTVREIAAQLSLEYEASDSEIEADTLELFSELAREKLILPSV